MGIVNILFTLVTIGVFAYFASNILNTWKRFHAVGKGIEENRTDYTSERIQNVFQWGLLQGKMFKDMVPGVMHFMIFWGFVTVSLGTIETILHGIYSPFDFKVLLGEGFFFNAFLFLQDWANFFVFVAVGFAFLRRIVFPPKRLQTLADASKKDAFIVLGLIMSLVFTALLTMGGKTFVVGEEALPAGALPLSRIFASVFGGVLGLSSSESWNTFADVFWWLHVAVLYGFITFLPFSKHQHLIWVWPNMFFKSRKGSGRLRPMEFDEEAESFGVGEPTAFTWKQFLDSMACVECGRCTAECPAYATGKPLDPRLMIHHLKDAMIDTATQPEDKRKTLIGEIVSRDELWACTTCGACMEACPLEIEHIPAIVDMRRYMTLTEGEMPPELQNTLQNLENQSNPWGISNEKRADWAKGLGVTTMAENSDVEYLFWVGCAGSFDDRYKEVSKSIVNILQKAGISFSILGKEEKCNGDTARRAGNEYLANMQIEENVETFKRYKVQKVVTGCPHCFNTIKNEYPDFGFNAEVIHHSELISDLIKNKKIAVDSAPTEAQKLTFHDSCYLGRHNNVYDQPREALEGVPGIKVTEMERSRDKGFCCGAGGARMWMEETIGSRINVNRAEEAIETGANTVAVACPFCMTMLKDGVTQKGKDSEIQIKDISEIVSESLKQ